MTQPGLTKKEQNMMNKKWAEDKFAESRMKALSIPFHVEEVPATKIDWSGSELNRARTNKALNEETVTDYAAAMENGDQFPMIVLSKGSSKGYVIAGGHHRAAAWQLFGEDSIRCYVIDKDDEVIKDVLPRVLNRGHGLQQDRKEAIQSAMFVMSHYGYSLEDASKLFCISHRYLQVHMRIQEVRAGFSARKIPHERLPDTVVQFLSPIVMDKVRDEAAKVIINSGMGWQATKDFLNELKTFGKKSEADQLGVVYDYARRIGHATEQQQEQPVTEEGATPLKLQNARRSSFLRALTNMENEIKKGKSLTYFQIIDKNERDTTKKRLAAAGKKLTELSN
jgi:hypothetical protein